MTARVLVWVTVRLEPLVLKVGFVPPPKMPTTVGVPGNANAAPAHAKVIARAASR
jgi:hypothetical protein